MGARRKSRAATVDGYDVLPELLDPGAGVWHDQATYRAFMRAHGWTMPAAERMGHRTHPTNRRQAAATGWARDNDITDRTGGHADLHRLRVMGLIE